MPIDDHKFVQYDRLKSLHVWAN